MTTLFLLTFGLALGIGFLFALTDRQDVMANWDEKRCNLPVMLFGNFYKPKENPKSDIEFATDNFKFCTSKIVETAIREISAPFLAMMNQQLDVFSVLQKVLGSVREMIGNFFRTFSNLLDGMFQRFINISFEMRKIFIMFFQAMSRAAAIAVSTVFMGLSMITGIDNAFQFIIKVVMIVLGIMAAIIIILIFILFPVMPVIITTIGVLVAAGISEAGGFAGVFCFAPDTQINLQNGTSVSIEKIKLGDILENGEEIEGILKTNGTDTDIYMLGKTRVSGDHLVFYEPLKSWILVKEHPDAKKQIKREPILYCLNTTNHTIPIDGYLFRDWEELEDKNTSLWNTLVAKFLGDGIPSKKTNNYPLLSGDWKVNTSSGKKDIRDIQANDILLDKDGKEITVIGVYYGWDNINDKEDTFWKSDSIWTFKNEKWTQNQESKETKASKRKGFQLVTDSGSFMIYSKNEEVLVRDFTEVGIDKISETYNWTKKTIS